MALRTFEFDAGDLPEDTTIQVASYLADRRVIRFVMDSAQWEETPDSPVLSGNDASYWQLRRDEAAKQGQMLGGPEADEAERLGAFAANEIPGTDVQVQPTKPSGDLAMPTAASRATSGPGQDGPEVRFGSAPQTPVEEAQQVEAQDQQQATAHDVNRGAASPRSTPAAPIPAPAAADIEAHSLEEQQPQMDAGAGDDSESEPRTDNSPQPPRRSR